VLRIKLPSSLMRKHHWVDDDGTLVFAKVSLPG
jgi:hypothetical protein